MPANARAEEFPLLQGRVAEAERLVYPAFASATCQADEVNRNRWYSLGYPRGAGTTAASAAQVWLSSSVWPRWLVATLGGGTSVLTSMARRQGTLSNYLDARTRAERLRSLYFVHLARPLAPQPGQRRPRHRRPGEAGEADHVWTGVG